jgi:hypothetical protein
MLCLTIEISKLFLIMKHFWTVMISKQGRRANSSLSKTIRNIIATCASEARGIALQDNPNWDVNCILWDKRA